MGIKEERSENVTQIRSIRLLSRELFKNHLWLHVEDSLIFVFLSEFYVYGMLPLTFEKY